MDGNDKWDLQLFFNDSPTERSSEIPILFRLFSYPYK